MPSAKAKRCPHSVRQKCGNVRTAKADVNQPGAKVRAGWLAERGAANRLEGVGIIAVQHGMRSRGQEAQKWMGLRIDARSQFGPMSGGDGRTAIAVSSTHGLDFAAARALIVHRLPHAAGVRQGRRDRHAEGNKNPREQKNQHQSGGQAMHGQPTTTGHKNRGHKARAQVPPVIGNGSVRNFSTHRRHPERPSGREGRLEMRPPFKAA